MISTWRGMNIRGLTSLETLSQTSVRSLRNIAPKQRIIAREPTAPVPDRCGTRRSTPDRDRHPRRRPRPAPAISSIVRDPRPHRTGVSSARSARSEDTGGGRDEVRCRQAEHRSKLSPKRAAGGHCSEEHGTVGSNIGSEFFLKTSFKRWSPEEAPKKTLITK